MQTPAAGFLPPYFPGDLPRGPATCTCLSSPRHLLWSIPGWRSLSVRPVVPWRDLNAQLRPFPPRPAASGRRRRFTRRAVCLSGWRGVGGWWPHKTQFRAQEHMTLAQGRDDGDASPLTGVFTSGGRHQLSVSLDVQPLSAGLHCRPADVNRPGWNPSRSRHPCSSDGPSPSQAAKQRTAQVELRPPKSQKSCGSDGTSNARCDGVSTDGRGWDDETARSIPIVAFRSAETRPPPFHRGKPPTTPLRRSTEKRPDFSDCHRMFFPRETSPNS